MFTRRSILALLLAAILLAGCAPTIVTVTTDPGEVKSMVGTSVAQTLAAEQAAQVSQATNTPIPTNTPEPTATPLPTNTTVPTLISPPTATDTAIVPPSGGGGGGGPAPTPSPYQCMWVTQTPSDWTVIKPGVEFDVVWTVKNTGAKIWGATDIDLMYLRGEKMQTYFDVIDLPAQVGLNKTVELKVDMTAPKTPGYYSATWTLKGVHEFCTLTISITVKE